MSTNKETETISFEWTRYLDLVIKYENGNSCHLQFLIYDCDLCEETDGSEAFIPKAVFAEYRGIDSQELANRMRPYNLYSFYGEWVTKEFRLSETGGSTFKEVFKISEIILNADQSWTLPWYRKLYENFCSVIGYRSEEFNDERCNSNK